MTTNEHYFAPEEREVKMTDAIPGFVSKGSNTLKGVPYSLRNGTPFHGLVSYLFNNPRALPHKR